jgi:putative pyruvate formate lyase activating enzyme
VASFSPHFGEEQVLVGEKGSGTIFFSHCNLKCVFCQNYDISVTGAGREVDDEQIAFMMLDLQRSGCHNINLVTPSHVVPQILNAVNIAAESGLHIPLVYNSSGYDSLDTLKLLKGVVDIYMPDFKFRDPDSANRFCRAKDYPDVAKKAIKEMHDQVGDLKMDRNGIACSGLLVRHLVMPGTLADTRWILKFLKEEISAHTHVNIMSQYRPMGEAFKFKALSRPVTAKEFRTALNMAGEFNLTVV